MVYYEMYFLLFNAITEALIEINNDNYLDAKYVLMRAQQICEEIYINCDVSYQKENL